MSTFLRLDRLWICLYIACLMACSGKKDIPTPVDGSGNNDKEDYGTSLWGTITDENNQPLEGVVVTNGFKVTKTNSKGIYQLDRNAKARFVYYTTPARYEVNLTSDKHPDFYAKIDLAKSFRYDFKLKKMAKKEKWTLICIGDPQPANSDDVGRYKNETLADIDRTAQMFQNTGEEVYALTLGDIVHNDFGLYPSMKAAMGKRRIPYFQTLGNHDHGKNVSDDKAHEVYEDYFGPRNYSLDRGNAHIIVIDNYINLNSELDKPTGGLTDQIWEWVQADLAQVPKDKLVILAAHVPFRQGTATTHGRDVVNLLKTYKEAHIMTAHTHTNYKYKHDGNPSSQLTEHTHGTACGAHWRSRICSDGTPNGYAVYRIDDNNIADYYYKATGEQYDRSYQMRLYDGAYQFYKTGMGYYFNQYFGEVNNRIVANIWNGDSTWFVTLEEDGYAPVIMSQANQEIMDWCAYSYHLHYKDKIWDATTTHYWQARLPSGKKPAQATFTIKAKDVRNNITYTSSSSPTKPNIQFDYTGIAYP